MKYSLLEILGVITAVIAIIGAFYKGIKEIRIGYKNFLDKRSKFFTGSWTNEGDITTTPTHYMDLDIKVEDDELSGVFNVRDIDSFDGHTWHSVGIDGKLFFNTAICEIYHYREGRRIMHGKVKLKKVNKRNIEWKIISDPAQFFPKDTIIFPRFNPYSFSDF